MKNKAEFEPLGDDADNGLGKENLPAIIGEMMVVPAFFADGSGHGTARLSFSYPSPDEIRVGATGLADLVCDSVESGG